MVVLKQKIQEKYPIQLVFDLTKIRGMVSFLFLITWIVNITKVGKHNQVLQVNSRTTTVSSCPSNQPLSLGISVNGSQFFFVVNFEQISPEPLHSINSKCQAFYLPSFPFIYSFLIIELIHFEDLLSKEPSVAYWTCTQIRKL